MSNNLNKIVSLDSYFTKKTQELAVSEPTRAYLISIFKKTNQNIPNESLTIIYAEAKFKNSFELYQNIGDVILFLRTIYPESLNDATPEYYVGLAQNSYYSCYKILNKQWKLYLELAEKLPDLTTNLRKILHFPH